MKYIKPMNCEEFAQHLLTLKNGDVVEFGCDPGPAWPDEVPDPSDVTTWYFAKVIEIKGYNSRFILLDYCGGEEAFAIPLNGYKNGCDEDDRRFVPRFVKHYFSDHNIHLNGPDDHVFVEMED